MSDSNSSHIKYPSRPPTYFIRTFGCQMNVADSLIYARVLESLGCIKGKSEESSDILVINTCSVRAKAEEKAISYIGAVIQKRAEYRKRTGAPHRCGIAFVGCMATIRGVEIRSRFPDVRVVVSARELDSFKDQITRAWPELADIAVDKPILPLLRPVDKFERFVPIVRGCVNHCTFCIVPRARGNWIRSSPPLKIFAEVDNLIESGIKSITFLGQNVCSYGNEIKHDSNNVPPGWVDVPSGYDFADLLIDIRDRFGDRDVWFKFLTSYPRDVTDKLIDVVASHPSFSHHFHLPIQSGDNKVLKRMGRGYTSEFYISLIDRIRDRIPDARLSTDIIVGFPGEDDVAFERTMEMLRKIRFDSAFTFLYSLRSGTPAEKLADPVPRPEKKRRLQDLIDLQNKITLERARGKIGQERIVLIEGAATRRASRESELVAGRTREEEVVIIPGSEEDYGNRIRVILTAANLRSFTGERLDS